MPNDLDSDSQKKVLKIVEAETKRLLAESVPQLRIAVGILSANAEERVDQVMDNDRRESHEEPNEVLHEQPRPVHDVLQRVCRLDGVAQNENGECPVCGRVLSAPRSESDAPDDQVETTPTAQFYERLERQRREREQEAASRATKTEPEISAPRDWRKFLDSTGNVRW